MNTPSTSPTLARGIYCLANDGVLQWFIAFAKSLRERNPDLPLRVIPFDNCCTELKKLRSIYNFSIVEAPLGAYDAIGERFYPGRMGARTFRKFYAFEGEFDEFLFLDADIVVLDDLSPLFEAYARGEADVLCLDVDPLHVYAPGENYERSLHDAAYKPFNTGIWMARRDLLKLEQLGDLARAARERGQIHANFFEQPFLNFCLHDSGARVREFCQVLPQMFDFAWAANPDINACDPIVERFNPTVARNGKWMPFLHWAGYGSPPVIPNNQIYLHFRLGGESALQKARFHSRYNVVQHHVRTGYKRNAGRVQRVLKRLAKRR